MSEFLPRETVYDASLLTPTYELITTAKIRSIEINPDGLGTITLAYPPGNWGIDPYIPSNIVLGEN